MKLRSSFCQRGRGRRAGRAVRERGRMRKRGASGGGTLRRKSPPQGEWPSLPRGGGETARRQGPGASQGGLMEFTAEPGKDCICTPSIGAKLTSNPFLPF